MSQKDETAHFILLSHSDTRIIFTVKNTKMSKPSPAAKKTPEKLNPDDFRHSPVHYAVAVGDHTTLSRIVATLPRLADPKRIHTESDSLNQEKLSDQIAAVLDRRDNPKRETALHLAVRTNDVFAARALANAGADVSLQNADGWNALQEAVCRRCTEIVAILVQYHHVSAWSKWRRRLPRLLAVLRRMRDFYMEISFHFESSIVPFVGKIAPSDTYKIWKRDGNLRADTSLAGYDGLKIQRANQSFLFLGDGDENLDIPSGSLLVLNHDNRQIFDAFENAGSPLTDSNIAGFCAQTSVYRPGMDVTKAELFARMNWRRQEKIETVGEWKARVYEIHNVHFSFRSRKITATDSSETAGSEQIMPLELEEDSDDGFLVAENPRYSVSDRRRHSSFVSGDREVVSVSRKSVDIIPECRRRSRAPPPLPMQPLPVVVQPQTKEKEYVKTLRPSVWLTDNFPLQTEELLPLLDILANKVKAVRRMRELLTTKFPPGTFPVKVAIPVVPTVRVMITFTKFVELQRPEEQFFTPVSSPRQFFSGGRNNGYDDVVVDFDDDDKKGNPRSSVSSSWLSRNGSRSGLPTLQKGTPQVVDPFAVPIGYAWSSFDEKGKQLKKSKSTSRKVK
ncbi:putative ankyrin repeat domain-containing protein [Helianthus annuus]|uniref:Ankyrin repeat domain-containing protein n=2 Tax=Helianthus annuus TaxID=4232 RepID=A0A251T4S1_HELAN|nr:putative ankyrin repeat domain-containing protein [Helianthus annuus]KAJ0438519.1 putative ankyrin repeat domain-containing protein [Helianthus annuus]KAJ0641284.1 putative ankyrin repeat domain-containing protein [Helianthus annuus]